MNPSPITYHPTVAYRRKVAVKCPYNEEKRLLENYSMYLQAADMGSGVHYIKEPLVGHEPNDKHPFPSQIPEILEVEKVDRHSSEYNGPMVSIIIPTCGRPGFLKEALESVLSQTFKNFEIIVINDGGKDISEDINSLENSGKVVYLQHKDRRGPSAARNTGLKQARGKYIAYLDDDDIYYPNHLETLVVFLERNNYKVAYTDSYQAFQTWITDRYTTIDKRITYSYDFDRQKFLISNYIHIINIVHRRELLDEIELFDEGLETHEDWDMCIRLSQKYDFYHIKAVTAEFRTRDDMSSATNIKRVDFLRTLRLIHKRYSHLVTDPNILEAQKRLEKSLAMEVEIRQLSSSVMEYECLHQYRFAKEFVKDKKVLVLGGGKGYGSFILSEDAESVTCIDKDERNIRDGSANYIKENLEFIKGSITDVPVKEEKIFDVIVCFEALEQVEDHNELMKEAKRLLKDDGIFIVSSSNKYVSSDQTAYQKPPPLKELSLDDFKSLLKEHFKNILIYGQKVFPSSNIFPLFESSIPSRDYAVEKSDRDFLFVPQERKGARYLIAVSSDGHMQDIPGNSYLVDVSETLFKLKDGHISNLGAALREKDAHIGNLEAVVRDKNVRISNLEDAVRGKDAHISSLEAIVRNKESHISNLEATVRDKESHISNLEAAVRDKDAHVTNLEAAVMEKEATLNHIYISHGWKALLTYYRIRNKLLPVGSMRRSIAKWIFKTILLFAKCLQGKGQVLKDGNLIYHIDSDLSKPFIVGAGNALYLHGWCFHRLNKIKKLCVLIDGMEHLVRNFSLVRYDAFDHFQRTEDQKNSLNSGFWTMIPFKKIEAQRQIPLALRTKLSGGKICEASIGILTLQPSFEKETYEPEGDIGSSEKPLIAICMATYNPSMEYFEKQIKSIRKQTYTNWVCIINDDSSEPETFEKIKETVADDRRFKVYRNRSNLGFYYNFECCLSKVPRQASFIALSDQDDHWHIDKLSILLNHFDSKTTLVYSDMNIVDKKGEKIHSTYWTTRRNNFTKLDLLILANTITGAACMFRAGILESLLPFPERTGDSYHDNFIACTALCLGEIRYVDAPLYDYQQHAHNIFGHKVPASDTKKRRWIGSIGRTVISIQNMRRNYAQLLLNYQSVYYHDFIRRVLIAHVLSLRCKDLASKKRSVIRQFLNWEKGISTVFLQVLKNKVLRREDIAVGNDTQLLKSVLSVKLLRLLSRFRRSNGFLSLGMQTYDQRRSNLIQATRQTHQLDVRDRSLLVDISFLEENPVIDVVNFIRHMISPLNLRVSEKAKERVNSLISMIDFKYFFAGYIGMFNLVKMLAKEGYNVRMIIVDECKYEPWVWRREIKKYEGLEDFFDLVEVVYAYSRSEPIEVSRRDVFLANSWWTAHVANAAREHLNAKRFLYFTQEYEPAFYRIGTCSALALESYTFPHYAIFSTEILREYFRRNGLGVFREGRQSGDENSLSIENAILRFEIDKERMMNQGKKKFLFYARPEEHAARNMFELGVMALSNVIKGGSFDTSRWEFYGIGSVEAVEKKITLDDHIYMRLMPKMSLNEYKDFLPEFDIGLSLMLSPHPSIVPLEMAAAGMLVVTNTFANKTVECLREISANIISAEPTVEGIEDAIVMAIKNVNDYDRRIKGARVNWSQNWKDTFDEGKITKIKKFINNIIANETKETNMGGSLRIYDQRS